jgi:NitT/TauT family transport system substrate-binding protein
MGCCDMREDEAGSDVPADAGRVTRRDILRGLAGASGIAAMTHALPAGAAQNVKLAFCGQLLCVVPYEVTKARGHFAAEGLDVQLVYTRGGSAAMQALVGGAVDYAATSLDVAVQAFGRGAAIRRFASTGRLPLFALAAGPKSAAEITDLKKLEGKTLGVSALGNADHALALYLLEQAGADPKKVRFAILGTNLYDALRLGQVDAGMVQEPALTLLRGQGGTALVNMMSIEDAQKFLGGAYEFMGVSVRAAEREQREEEMKKLARALAKGLRDTVTMPVDEIVAALPKELVAGGDRAQLVQILETNRRSLYPDGTRIDHAAAERVVRSLASAELVKADFPLDNLLDQTVAGG